MKKAHKKIDLLRYESLIKTDLRTIVDEMGYKLEKLVFANENNVNYLRLKISHPGHPISLKDCELVSRKVEKELDQKNIIPFPYTLEVESPGITDKESKPEFVLNHRDMSWGVKVNN